MSLKNKQNLRYANLTNAVPKYLYENGEIVTTEVDGESVPVVCGYLDSVYENPVSFLANITPIGSESYARHNTAIARAYGIDVSEYEALIVLKAGEYPLHEATYVWHASEPKYVNIGGSQSVVDVSSADYKVERVATSKNVMLAMLRRTNHDQKGVESSAVTEGSTGGD